MVFLGLGLAGHREDPTTHQQPTTFLGVAGQGGLGHGVEMTGIDREASHGRGDRSR
jgi:hypothetical protein